jgi:hypothetical protein
VTEYTWTRYSNAVSTSKIVPNRIMRFFMTLFRIIFATLKRTASFLIDGVHGIYDGLVPSEQ